MRIDPRVEAPAREMLDHAMKGSLDEIPKVIEGLDPQQYQQAIGLCALISGYAAIDICGSQWPIEADLRKIAENVAKRTTRFTLDATQLYEYLSRSALRFEPLERVFGNFQDAANWPILMTASLIVTYCPPGKNVWQYLDEIETGIEAADEIPPHVVPAVILKAYMPPQGSGSS